MRLSKLPGDFKPQNRFEKLSKNDTLYLLSTPKYKVNVEFACSNFYAPEFYYVNVTDKNNIPVWSGKKAVFLDSLFRTHFISDCFDKVVLNRVNDTSNSKSQQIVLIDLKTGKEEVLTQEGFFADYGHHQSFDAVFYNDFSSIVCIDLVKQEKIHIKPIFDNHFPKFRTWSVCSQPYCVLVVTEEHVENLKLFNLYEEKIVATATIPFAINKSVNLNFNFIENSDEMILKFSTTTKATHENFARANHNFFKLSF